MVTYTNLYKNTIIYGNQKKYLRLRKIFTATAPICKVSGYLCACSAILAELAGNTHYKHWKCFQDGVSKTYCPYCSV